MKELTRLHGLILNWRTIVASLILIIVSLCLLWVSEKFASHSQLWLGQVLPSFAAVIGTSGVFAVVYELLVRRQQTRYVLEALELRESLIRTGLDDITTNYMDYDYAKQIINSTDIVIFVLYAQTWITRYAVELTQHLEASGKSITLCAPSFENPFLPALSQQFEYSIEEMKRRIKDSIHTITDPAIKGKIGKGSNVRVIWHNARPSYSLYKFDKQLLVGTYYASRARRRAPMFEFIDSPGSMFEEFNSDIMQVIEEGKVIYDHSKNVNLLVESFG